MKVRSLYDCLHAKYPSDGEYIICLKGHKLGQGNVHKRQVDRGAKLTYKCCQLCKDFSSMDDLTPLEK